MAVIGIGLPLGTVGVTVVATELSTKENFPRNLKFMQSIYSIGALAYSIVPGVIADLCGSYDPSVVLSLGMFIAYGVLMHLVFIQSKKLR